jgi:surfeit locus 1 family protein
MKKFSPGVIPTVMTVPVILIMLALSIWQLNRYMWKVDLLDTIASQLAEAPVAFPIGEFDIENMSYRRVSIEGQFDHSKEIHLFSHTIKGLKGFQVITPFILSNDQGTILVNRGWVPERLKEAKYRVEGNIGGVVTLTGIVRKPWFKSYSFLPQSNTETNVWLYGELPVMADFLKVEAKPVFVELDNLPVPGGWPKGGQTRVSVPNNHIAYFFTWMGLALTMMVIYGIYGLKRGSQKVPGEE